MANLYSPGIYFGRKSSRTVFRPASPSEGGQGGGGGTPSYPEFGELVELINFTADDGLTGWTNNDEASLDSQNTFTTRSGNPNTRNNPPGNYFATVGSTGAYEQWLKQSITIPEEHYETIDNSLVFVTLSWLQSSRSGTEDKGHVQLGFYDENDVPVGALFKDDGNGWDRGLAEPWRDFRTGGVLPNGTRRIEVVISSSAGANAFYHDCYIDEIEVRYGNTPDAFTFMPVEILHPREFTLTGGTTGSNYHGFRRAGNTWGDLSPRVVGDNGEYITVLESRNNAGSISNTFGVQFDRDFGDWDRIFVPRPEDTTVYAVLSKVHCTIQNLTSAFSMSRTEVTAAVDDLNSLATGAPKVPSFQNSDNGFQFPVRISNRYIPNTIVKEGDPKWSSVVSLLDFHMGVDDVNYQVTDRQGHVWSLELFRNEPIVGEEPLHVTAFYPREGAGSDRYMYIPPFYGLQAPSSLDADLQFDGDFVIEIGFSDEIFNGTEWVLHSPDLKLKRGELIIGGSSTGTFSSTRRAQYTYYSIQRRNGTINVWIDGVLRHSVSDGSTLDCSGLILLSDGTSGGSSNDLHLTYVSDIRITKGDFRYDTGVSRPARRQSFPYQEANIKLVRAGEQELMYDVFDDTMSFAINYDTTKALAPLPVGRAHARLQEYKSGTTGYYLEIDFMSSSGQSFSDWVGIYDKTGNTEGRNIGSVANEFAIDLLSTGVYNGSYTASQRSTIPTGLTIGIAFKVDNGDGGGYVEITVDGAPHYSGSVTWDVNGSYVPVVQGNSVDNNSTQYKAKLREHEFDYPIPEGYEAYKS